MKLALVCLVCWASTVFAQVETKSPVVYVDDSYPPFSYLKDSQLKGIYPDILMQIKARNPDLQFIVEPVHWLNGKSKLINGEGSTMLGFYYNVVGHEFIEKYSPAVVTEKVVLVCGQEDNVQPELKQWPQEFTGKLVANVEGYNGWLRNQVRSEKNTKYVNFFEVPDTFIALKMVVKGKVDCALFENMAFTFVLQQLRDQEQFIPNQDKFPVIAANIAEETGHFGYMKKAENCTQQESCRFAKEFDSAIIKLTQDGSIAKIVEKHAFSLTKDQ